MDDQGTLFTSPTKREPWNKGRFTGAKPPLRPKHVWSIRSKLQAEDAAMVGGLTEQLAPKDTRLSERIDNAGAA